MFKEKSDYSQPNALTVQTTAGVLPKSPGLKRRTELFFVFLQ